MYINSCIMLHHCYIHIYVNYICSRKIYLYCLLTCISLLLVVNDICSGKAKTTEEPTSAKARSPKKIMGLYLVLCGMKPCELIWTQTYLYILYKSFLVLKNDQVFFLFFLPGYLNSQSSRPKCKRFWLWPWRSEVPRIDVEMAKLFEHAGNVTKSSPS